jgi:hypothetical protein
MAHLPNPGVDISIVLRRVRADVIQATNQKQVPWDIPRLLVSSCWRDNSVPAHRPTLLATSS